MSKPYPLVGYTFCIIRGDTILVTGDVIQGHGDSAYLVRFNTDAPYTRVLHTDDSTWTQMNLFKGAEELSYFVAEFHARKARAEKAAKEIANMAKTDAEIELSEVDDVNEATDVAEEATEATEE
jgi:hypothetical protein